MIDVGTLSPRRSLIGRRLLRGLGWLAFAGWLAFVALVLVLRFAILPRVADYRVDIEQAASRAVGQEIRIGRIEAHWRGLNPELVLNDLSVLDAEGRPGFSLSRIDAVLSWQTLWRLQPTLALLAFEQPVLHVRRETDGRIRIAGISAEGESDPRIAEWVLRQPHIRIRNATLVWEDALRQAPPLLLKELQFGLDNWGRRHRLGLSAAPPSELAARIDMRAEVYGELHEALEKLSGRLFVELSYADLAGWKAWVDYPIDLSEGRGAVRVWGELDEGEGKLTTDVALESVHMRLGKTLPRLELASLRGRLYGSYSASAWTAGGRRVELLTGDGLRLSPTDFNLEWQQTGDGVRGKASANLLDLTALSSLAAYLPLDARSRSLLTAYAPTGRIDELRASWKLAGELVERYTLAAGFQSLGVRAEGYFPGARGLSGTIEASEKGGTLTLDSAQSKLSLPAVFPEPDIGFDTLKARVNWKKAGEVLDLRLEKLAFTGPDADGQAQGTYHYTGQGPGVIDLTASISRADGRAVWRYMPHAVNFDARDWLRHGITGGTAHDGRLVLRGDLQHFPFRDPATGEFSVVAKARGARIDYARGWPVIEDIDADMQFGVGMKVRAERGRILGANLSNVLVEIPDFDVHDEMLLVRGVAQGPTGDFLKFIETSPVAESIDRFTDGMKASGNGRLDLELDLPLRRIPETRLRGQYRFIDNKVEVVEGLPAITQVNGRLDLTDRSVNAEEITGRGFGGPLRVQVRSAAGGKVSVLATGTANIAEVSRHFGWPLINHLSGTTPWRAEVGIVKRNATLAITSDLLGISSPLPDALNKSATQRLPLRIERVAPTPPREEYRITLGDIAQGVIERQDGQWLRGVFAVGDKDLRPPEHGLDIRVAAPKIDVDAWRNYLPSGGDATPPSQEDGASGLVLNAVRLKTGELLLMGRSYQGVELNVRPRGASWAIGVETRDVAGELVWLGAGDGRLDGRLRRLYVNTSSAGNGSDTVLDSLPAMSLVVDDLHINDKALGRLDVRARNQGGVWLLDRLLLQNPDGSLSGKGSWQRGSAQRTQLDFELKAKDAGKLLNRLGYEDAMRRGEATLSGNLAWNGPLTTIHYPSLGGRFAVRAEKGQFNQLEPGVGRLLGLISLQSLPRRLTLDFNDIFSQGLAFDSIESDLVVKAGVMRTQQPLNIIGPAVQILIDGQTDLQRETQDLQVTVRPEVGNLAAVGAAIVNPVAGAAALVANTVLQKPLNRLFSYRYHVTGTWSEPLVDKAGHSEEPASPLVEEEKKP